MRINKSQEEKVLIKKGLFNKRKVKEKMGRWRSYKVREIRRTVRFGRGEEEEERGEIRRVLPCQVK
jgi:hypothetical protein